jgi:hypothetical protein
MKDADDKFYDRADEHIHLSNSQITEEVGSGKVSASFMYSVARFNAWLTACGFENSQDMQDMRDENIEYFMKQYRVMLEENFDDYITNFNSYMEIPSETS